jgi:hypothetical protein
MEQVMSPKLSGMAAYGAQPNEAHSSGVSWSAVFAGAAGMAALSLILLSLGTGLGLSSVSPWDSVGASASTIKASAILWLIFAAIFSSAFGGYLAGRLRTKWANIHGDEVYFRDTAHGFLAWSTALVITAAFLGTAAASMVGSSVESGKTSTSTTSAGDSSSSPNGYFVDYLFRTDGSKPEATSPLTREEATSVFAHSLVQGSLDTSDRTYLSQLVAANTGLSASDADKRVSDVFTNAQMAAEKARKSIAHSLLWIFLALLIGAFSASFAATIGGRQRDNVVII